MENSDSRLADEPNGRKPTSFVFFKTEQHLGAFLHAQGIDLSGWGLGEAKTIENLWHELQSGESRLQVEPLRRLVEVATIIVPRGQVILIERAQLLQGERYRRRNWPPSEKVQPQERARAAAIRCLCEELELDPSEFTLDSAPPLTGRDEQESTSFPGLISDYTFYLFQAACPTLPKIPFSTSEKQPTATEPVKTHYWEWNSPPPLVARLLQPPNSSPTDPNLPA